VRALFATILLLSPLCAQANLYELFAKKYGLDPYLIKSVAWVESQGHPWTINMDGMPFSFTSKQEAILFVKERRVTPCYVLQTAQGKRLGMTWFASEVESQRQHKAVKTIQGTKGMVTSACLNPYNVDIGLMQINWRYHQKTAGFTVDELFDPVFNLDYASRFLAQLIRDNGTWPGIVKYHSNRPVNQALYAQRIWKAYRGLVVEDYSKRGVSPPAAEMPVQWKQQG